MNNRTWHDIGSDVNWIDYGGRWARHISGTRYHVIRFDNMIEALGERDFKNGGFKRYAVDLQEVDTTSLQLQSALESCGYNDDPDFQPLPLNLVEALSGYGAYAPLDSASGNNAHALMRAMKRESRRLESDAIAYQASMDRPVNRLGATAREYQTGDMSSATSRGLEAGDPKAELIPFTVCDGGGQRVVTISVQATSPDAAVVSASREMLRLGYEPSEFRPFLESSNET